MLTLISQAAVSRIQDVDYTQNHIHAVKGFMRYRLCVKPMRGNLHPAFYISHQKLCKHTASSTPQKLWRQKNCPRYLWLTESEFWKGQPGQVKRWLWWCHRKEEQGQLEKGRQMTGQDTHTPPPTHINRRPFSHTQQLSAQSTIQSTSPFKTLPSQCRKNTLNLFACLKQLWCQWGEFV